MRIIKLCYKEKLTSSSRNNNIYLLSSFEALSDMIYAVALQKVFSISFKDFNFVTSSTSGLELYPILLL